MDSETRRFIRDEVYRQINIILSGEVDGNTEQTEGIKNLFPGMPTYPERPVMHPAGLVSRANDGIIQVTAKQGEHVGNRVVMGHRDKVRPSDLEQGEIVLYASDNETVLRRVHVYREKINIGSNQSNQPLVLGDVMREFARLWLRAWLDAPEVVRTAQGPGYLAPEIRQKFEEYIVTYIDDIDTNIVSQENFTERNAPEGGA